MWQLHGPFSLTTYSIYSIQKAFVLLFKRNLLSERLCLGREPTQASWEKRQNKSIYLETNIILIMLEISFPCYIHTHMIETLKPQPIIHKSKRINASKSSILLREQTYSFCPRKMELTKKGIARRVKHKQGFARNWRSRNIDWLLLRGRDWPRESAHRASVFFGCCQLL